MYTILQSPFKKSEVLNCIDRNSPVVLDALSPVAVPTDVDFLSSVGVYESKTPLFLIPDTSIPPVASDPIQPKRVQLPLSELLAPSKGEAKDDDVYTLYYSEEAFDAPQLRELLGTPTF